MQRDVGSMRVAHRITRFVPPAGSIRTSGALARRRARAWPGSPAAARAASRDPVLAVRRSARSLTTAEGPLAAATAAIQPASMRWEASRRTLRDPRSHRALSRPR